MPRALLLEDDRSVGLTLVAVLQEEGYEVQLAETTAAAIAAIDARPPDIAVLDLHVGDAPTGGLTVLEHLRSAAPSAVALILTGYGSLESAMRAIRGGAAAYLLKPVPPNEITAVLAEELSRRQSTAQAAAVRHLEILAAAGELLQRSLDPETTLRGIAELVVPKLADVCILDLADERGEIERVAATSNDPATTEALNRFPVSDRPLWLRPIQRAIRTGAPQLLERGPEGSTGETSEALGALRVTALLIVPLVARGRSIGAINLGMTGTRRFGPRDAEIAADLATRCALAIDNARLHAEALAEGDRARELASAMRALAEERDHALAEARSLAERRGRPR